jgi:large subunit ribosomal protein L21
MNHSSRVGSQPGAPKQRNDMYAIVEIAGKQYKVQANDRLYVPLMKADVDDEITFDRVLLFAANGEIQVGTPIVDGASVTATVLDHVKGDKVLVFKKIRRKRFKVKNGHRQRYTRIRVTGLAGSREESKETAEAEA